jgi:hypothetical protein
MVNLELAARAAANTHLVAFVDAPADLAPRPAVPDLPSRLPASLGQAGELTIDLCERSVDHLRRPDGLDALSEQPPRLHQVGRRRREGECGTKVAESDVDAVTLTAHVCFDLERFAELGEPLGNEFQPPFDNGVASSSRPPRYAR